MAVKAVGLSTHIWNNNIRSMFILTGFPLLILAMLWVGSYLLAHSATSSKTAFMPNAGSPADFANSVLAEYAFVVMAAVGLWFIVAWFAHSRMINAAVKSSSISRRENPGLYNMLENMCIASGMQMPVLRVINSPGLNAFASGINENTYTITFTQGLLDKLDNEEIEAVMAHELTHIINRDVRLLIVTVIFTGLIGFIAQFAFRSMIYGGRRRRDNGNGQIMIIAMIVLTVGYLFSLVMRFGLSRSREYMADAGAVEITQKPEAMMRALMKISGNDYVEETPADIEQMCIENSHNFMGIFATHPPIKKRVEALSELTGTPIPEILPGSEYVIGRGRNPWV